MSNKNVTGIQEEITRDGGITTSGRIRILWAICKARLNIVDKLGARFRLIVQVNRCRQT